MWKRWIIGLAVAALLGPPSAVLAATVDLPVERHTLDNGLTLLLLENHESPTLGLCTAFRVGSGDEWDGVTGVTHILEHMLFKGTEEIGTTDYKSESKLLEKIEEHAQAIKKLEYALPREQDPERLARMREEMDALRKEAKEYVVANELWEIYQNAGGTNMNADTGPDITRYYLALPSNRLELWLYLESSRLRHPILREFYTEIKNVAEERRLAIDTQPEGVLWEELAGAAFRAHNYGTLVIGHPSDIETLTRTETENYFYKYYAPNQMVIAIVGDMDPKQTLEMVEAYFGSIPRQDPPHPTETVEPEQKGERRVEREFDAEPQVLMGWHRPAFSDPDEPAYQVISYILDGGRSSRFNKNIIEGSQVAVSLDTDPYGVGERHPTLYVVQGVPRAPHTTGEVEEAVYQEFDRLRSEPVGDAELQKAKNGLEADFVRSLNSNFGMAQAVASAEAKYGDWEILLRVREGVQQVSADDVQRVANATFKHSNRTVATLVPESLENVPISAEAQQRAETILAQALDAMGGREALGRVKDLSQKSSIAISIPGGGKMDASAQSKLILPDHYLSELTVMGQKQGQGYDGETWWMAAMGSVQDMPKDRIKESDASLLREYFFFHLARGMDGLRLEAEQGEEPVVKVSTTDGIQFRIGFDAKTGLPSWMRYDTTNPMTMAAAEAEEKFSDFKKVRGVLLPHTTEVLMDGKDFVTQKVTSIEFNQGLDPEIFARPSS